MAPEDGHSYVPPPSIGHELGVMFGFIGVFIISMGLYMIWWKIANKRSKTEEDERIRTVRQQDATAGDEKAELAYREVH